MIGSMVGQYRILARIGEGGMGEVFRGEDTMLERQVAIKMLRPELAKQKTLVDRFRTEAVALARLNHPNIAAVYGLLQERGQLFMVLEFVDGETLESIVARRGPLPWADAVQVGKDTLAALEHAHKMGVVHRDLKPSNLMLTRAGQLKVMDFGIARLAGTSRHTEFGRIVGTPLYMSPEQLRGEEVDGRSDIYSLGVVLYELVTGREAFRADSDYALLMAQLNQMPEPPSRFVPDLPSDVEAAMVRSFQKAKADRWTSANAFRRALISLVADPVTAEFPVGVEVAASATAPPETTPRTRLATPSSSAPATRLAGEPPASAPNAGLSPVAAFLTPARIRIGGLGLASLVLIAVAVQALRPSPGETLTPPPGPQPITEQPVGPTPAPAPAPAVQPHQAVQPPPPPPPLPPPAPSALPPSTRVGQVVDPGEGRGRRPKPVSPPAAVPAPVNPGPSPTPPPPPAPAPPPPPPPPPPPAAEEAADLTGASAAFESGIAQIAGWLKAKDIAAVERSFAGDDATKGALTKLLKDASLVVEKPTLAASGPASGGRATAEHTATLRWRSSFGNTRKVPVRIVATYRRDGGSWRLASWRFAGKPDLD